MNPSTDRQDRSAAPSARAWSRFWAIAVLVSTIAVIVVSIVGGPGWLQTPVTVWFLAICPGMAIVRLLHLDQPLADVMLAIAISIALAGLVPTVLLYLGAWSTGWALVLLIAITGVALALDPQLVPRRIRTSAGAALQARVPIAWRGASLGDAQPAGPVGGQPAPPLARRTAPPVVVVTRLPRPASPTADADAVRARPLGTDPMAEDESAVALRSAFDRVVGDIANRRARDD